MKRSRISMQLTLASMAIALMCSVTSVSAQGGGGGGGRGGAGGGRAGGGRAGGGAAGGARLGAAAAPAIPGVTEAQQTALTTMNSSLMTAIATETAARLALTTASLANPKDDANIAAKLAELKTAIQAVADARAGAFASLQATDNKLNAEQVQALIQIGLRGGRGLGGAAAGRGGAAAGGGRAGRGGAGGGAGGGGGGR